MSLRSIESKWLQSAFIHKVSLSGKETVVPRGALLFPRAACWFLQECHSGGQKRNPIFATKLNYILNLSCFLTSIGQFLSLSLTGSKFMQKKEERYVSLAHSMNGCLGFCLFSFCCFQHQPNPLLCGRKFPIER